MSGIAALGVVVALVEPQFGEVAHVAGALAFAPGMGFLVVGRAELFSENFFDPVASAAEPEGTWLLGSLVRLWTITFVVNLVGGGLFAVVFSVEGTLPAGSAEALVAAAHHIVSRAPLAAFASAIVGGALVALFSFMLQGVNTVQSRIAMAFIVGFLLALGPFDHVVVSALHVFLGMLFGAPVDVVTFAESVGVAAAGNLVGGLGLVTRTHVAQAAGAEKETT